MTTGVRIRVAAAGALIVLLGCGDEAQVVAPPPEPPRAAAVSISPESVELDFIGATATFSATVTDQYGAAYPRAVAWTGDSPSVFDVSGEGVATALSNGAGSVVASVEGISDTASVSVSQVAASAELVRGGDQEGLPSAPLRDPVVVRVLDQGGTAVAGSTVRFVPSEGHGSADPDSIATDANGDAATVWTLGPETEPQLLTATVSDGPKVRITATATRGYAIGVVSGNRQRVLPGQRLPEVLVVRVVDGKGGPFPGTTVVFEPKEGHGSVSPDSAATDADGEAAAIWTLGDVVGGQTLTASISGGGLSTQFQATGLTGLGVCDRTAQIRDAIVAVVGARECADVTEGHLQSVTSLDLRHQDISVLYQDDFAGLFNLDSLHLSHNELRELPVGLFSAPTNLKELGLNANQLTDLPARVFDGLTRLQHLSLSGNRLATMEPGVFRHLSELDTLWLSHNRLVALAPGTFGGLTNLVSLGLQHNDIVSLSPGVFDDLDHLETLNVQANEIREVKPTALVALNNLQSLFLGGNKLDRLPQDTWANLDNLRRLNLWNNAFTQIDGTMFVGLHNLDTLDIGNQVGTIADDMFTELPSLTHLFLGTADFRPILSITEGWRGLRFLGVVAEAASELRAGLFSHLPHLRTLRLHVWPPPDNVTMPMTLWGENHELIDVPSIAGWGRDIGPFYASQRVTNPVHLPDDLFDGAANLERIGITVYSRSDVERIELENHTFRGLANLKSLSFFGYTAPFPDSVFFDLSGLEHLSSSYGNLLELGPLHFSRLGNLRSLRIVRSQVQRLSPEVFGQLGKLDHLTIAGNPLSVLPSGVLGGLQNLGTLSLAENRLSSLPGGVFHGLYRLESVSMRSNPGAPFPIHLSPMRIDTASLTAPGPASIVVTVVEGAPRKLGVYVEAPGATLSVGEVIVEAGETVSSVITVTPRESHRGAVILRIRDPYVFRPGRACPQLCYDGMRLVVADSITLFK